MVGKAMKWTTEEKQLFIHSSYVLNKTCHEISEYFYAHERTPKSISLMLSRHGYPYVMGSAA
jgi:hypothetical protein